MNRTFVSFNQINCSALAGAVDFFRSFISMLNLNKGICLGAYLSTRHVLKDFMDKGIAPVRNFSIKLNNLNLNLRKG